MFRHFFEHPSSQLWKSALPFCHPPGKAFLILGCLMVTIFERLLTKFANKIQEDLCA
jgi:hypothetical protein